MIDVKPTVSERHLHTLTLNALNCCEPDVLDEQGEIDAEHQADQ